MNLEGSLLRDKRIGLLRNFLSVATRVIPERTRGLTSGDTGKTAACGKLFSRPTAIHDRDTTDVVRSDRTPRVRRKVRHHEVDLTQIGLGPTKD